MPSWFVSALLQNHFSMMMTEHLDIREVSLECVGAGVACVEEH